MLTVDDYRQEDFKGLLTLTGHWDGNFTVTEEELRASLKDIAERTHGRILVARIGDEVVGYAQIDVRSYLGMESFMEIIQLLVSERHRSAGIGNALIERIEEETRKADLNLIKLCSQVHRSRAHVFYERLGYTFFKISKFYEKKLQ